MILLVYHFYQVMQILTLLISPLHTEAWITFCDVAGKCYVSYQDNLGGKSIDEHMNEGPHRFFFAEAYDANEKTFFEPPAKAQMMGGIGKVCLYCNALIRKKTNFMVNG